MSKAFSTTSRGSAFIDLLTAAVSGWLSASSLIARVNPRSSSGPSESRTNTASPETSTWCSVTDNRLEVSPSPIRRPWNGQTRQPSASRPP
ncbi:hypothetical protein GCM10017559_29360 [Streptosporangium longisporum]|uniref:Secreted protein n=2 Tax=Streptosporangium longisporum TaxID=46187 RepID=A0ABP6KI86_9ACTN